jgi:AraC-like DNA-binding protein
MRRLEPNPRMDYREFMPPPSLARHVECVWRLSDPRPAGGVQAIYPDGRCELIVHLEKPPRCWDGVEGWHAQARTLFAAQRGVAVRLESTRALDCIGIRLRPAASNHVLPRSAQQRDRIADLATLDGAFSRALARAVRAFASDKPDPLWKLLSRRCSSAVDARIASAVERLEHGGGRVRIDTLARESGLSRRGFQLRFRAAVGLTPKEFARLVRLQATLRALDATDLRIAELASDGGFSDQAHATRELRRVTGLTPARLRAELRRDRHGDAAVRLAAAFVRGYAG